MKSQESVTWFLILSDLSLFQTVALSSTNATVWNRLKFVIFRLYKDHTELLFSRFLDRMNFKDP